MRNFWFIGDIHGEFMLLDKLLEHVLRFQPGRIVFLGDYIDRGPASREVVERIMGLEVPVTCLMGNHEMMMLNAMDDMGFGYSPVELWYYNGGEATLLSFGSTSFFSFKSDLDQRYHGFFRNLSMSHVIPVHPGFSVLGIHAGVSPSMPVRDQVGMQDYMELNRYMLERQIDPGDSFLWVREAFFNTPPSVWDGYLVVHGHTPTLKLKRFIAANGQKNFFFVENDICIRKEEGTGRMVSIDIDSGSAISGRLTGLGFFIEGGSGGHATIRLRSLTVSAEELIPRDLGTVRM